MIIKNNNKAVDVQKNHHVCWEVRKNFRLSYVKKTVSYGKWSVHREPETIPAVSWEGGTTAVCKVWFERTNTIREGFDIRTEVEKQYVEPNKSLQNGVTASGNSIDGYSVTFPKRDETSNDLKILFHYMFDVSNDGYTYDNLYAGTKLYIAVEYKQTKRDKYVTKLDNASITTDLIPASGGNISSGTLTFRKTYNTDETENVTENVTFSTVSATTKGTTESPVTDVTTIPAGGTTQKQTTIDGVTLTHPSFTVKQAANTKTIKTPESKTTTSVILSVNPTVVSSSGGTVTFTLQRKYTLNKTLYQYTSGSTSGGGSDANQGPETVNANQTYTITGITNVSSTTGTSYKIPSSDTARTIKFKTTYDGITSNEASVSQTGIHTVTWNLQGGNINGDTSNKTETVPDKNTVSFTKYTPVKTGYTFNGWATSSAATSGSTTGNSAAITADTTFYATWKSATLTPILLILAHDAPQTKPKLEIGSILYSTNDNKLTLDAQTNGVNNTPIAICVIPDVYENLKNGDNSTGAVKTARFVSLNYMNYDSPSTGNKDPQPMYFGNYGTTIGNTKGGTVETSYVGGKWNTKRCVFKATNQDKTSDKVDNNPEEGYCAPACCCDRYSTPGTKQGDWYLPMPGELYQLANNKTVINEKRTALVGSGFSEGYSYWSSREYSSDYEYLVYLNGGSINYGDKSGYSYVLGFLVLEVPSFNIPSFKQQVNMEPVKLDTSSTKKKPAVADILYSTATGKLTLDAQTNGANNTPIAICVIPEVMENFKNGDNSTGAVKTARFVSLNYMNYDSPSTGNKDVQSIIFGNNGTTIGNTKGGTDKTSYIGGKWNTKQCLSKTANQDPYIYAGVTNNRDDGYCAPACCCVAYSTPGTKSGDWYLPMPGELYQIYANKTIINEKRTALVGSGFGNYYCWSSRENSSNHEYNVGLNYGLIYGDGKSTNSIVLGFLALEV